MERRYIAGHDIALTIPLTDQYDAMVDATALQYRIVDQDGVEVVPMTVVADFVTGSSEFLLTTTALQNTITAGSVREMRTVELYMSTAESMVIGMFDYFIETSAILVAGVNSFQTYNQAQLNVKDVAKVPGWEAATREDRINALRQAMENILRLTFVGYREDSTVDSMRLIVPGTTAVGSLRGYLGTEQYNALPATFIKALQRAQILEANFLLGGDEAEEIRRSGVMSTTVGESSQFYRTVKPLELPVCRRALQEIGRYISYSPRIAR